MAFSFTSYGVALLALMLPAGTALNIVQVSADAKLVRDVLAMKSSAATPMGDSMTNVLDLTDMGPHEDQINIEFGGSSHKEFSSGKGKHLETYISRPEAVKSKVCTGSTCEDCASPDSCWHGIEQDGWGFMEVVAQAGSSHTRYEAEVWARCISDDAKWKIQVYDCENGELVVYVDGKKVKKLTKKGKANIDKKIGSDQARIKITFEPKDKKKKAEARYYMYAEKMDQSVDGCMTAKECLSMLGDGSSDAFILRNNNMKQLRCLSGDESTMTPGLKMKCDAWRGCVAQSHKQQDLLALLKAASAPPPSLIAGVAADNLTVVADSDSCMHPSVDDPESWDCECAEEMVGICEGKSEPLELCVQNMLCANKNVCASWKLNHCDAQSSMAERSQKRTTNALDNNLDTTSQGKCAE